MCDCIYPIWSSTKPGDSKLETRTEWIWVGYLGKSEPTIQVTIDKNDYEIKLNLAQQGNYLVEGSSRQRWVVPYEIEVENLDNEGARFKLRLGNRMGHQTTTLLQD